MEKRIGEYWKETDTWVVQFPNGRMSYKLKRTAVKWSEQLKKDFPNG